MRSFKERLPYRDASHPILYGLAHFAVGQYLKTQYDVQIARASNLYEPGPRVDAISHTRALDPAVAGVTEEGRALPTMAKIELFEEPRYKKLGIQLGDLIQIVDAFPVRRENPGHNSLRVPLKHLKNGMAVGMFAQGTRNYDFHDLYMGAAFLSYLEDVPLQPVVIAAQPIQLSGFQRKELIRVIVSQSLRPDKTLRKRGAIGKLTEDLGHVFERDFQRARHWAIFDAKYKNQIKSPGKIKRYE